MKKLIFLIFAASLLAGTSFGQISPAKSPALPVSALFQDAGKATPVSVISVTAPTANVEVGTDFTIPVTVSDTTGQGIIAYQFDLHYDPAVIKPQDNAVDVAGTISSGLSAVHNPNIPGVIKVAVYGAYPLTGSGTLINFKFKAVGPAASVSQLAWTNLMFNEGNPASNSMDGQVRLVSANAHAIPTAFSGWELPRGKSFVLVSDDHTNSGSLSVSFETEPVPGSHLSRITGGYWTMMVYDNGNYFGSIYGDISDGISCEILDNTTGEVLERRIKIAVFRVLGGKDGYGYVRGDQGINIEFSSKTKYADERKTTATIRNPF